MLTASPSNPTRNNATIAVTFDDFITTGLVANTPSTAEEQAAAIKGITEPSRKDKRVAIPAVAPGFKATLTDITPAGYVDSEGKILKRESNKDVTVTVRVQVYDERNERAVKTEQFTFTLLKAYNPTILHDEFTAGELPNQVIGGVKVPGIPNPCIDETRLRIPQAAFEWTSPTMICIVRSFRTDLPPR